MSLFPSLQLSIRGGQLVSGGSAALAKEASESVVKYLSQAAYPSSTTVKLQSAFEGDYAQAQGAVDLKRRAHSRRLNQLADGLSHASVCVDGIGVDLGRVAAVYTAMSSYVHTFLEAEPSVGG